MKDGYTEDGVLEALRRKGVGIEGKWLLVKSGSLGIRYLGAVDFLVNHKGYKVRFGREK
jgi:hypothetical protein